MIPYYQDEACTVYHGDCRDMEWPEADLIWTDPPYAVKDIELYSTLGEKGAAALKPGGHLFSYVGQIALPDALERLCAHLTYWWILSSFYENRATGHVWSRGVRPLWKPIAWLRKEPQGIPAEWVFDTVTSPKAKASGHPWEQPSKDAVRYLSILASNDDVILDPFMGSGSTLRAAKDCGRKSIGIEVEERYCEIAVKSLGQEVFAV